MAKTSVIERNKRRIILAKRAFKARKELKKIMITNPDMTEEIMIKLQKRSRDESLTRVRERCSQCGRPRGTYRRFNLCRIHLREAMMRGDVPGVRKGSW